MNRIKKWIVFFCFLPVFQAHAMGGKLQYLAPPDSSPNWSVEHPKFVVAIGLMEPKVVAHYERFLNRKFKAMLHEVNPLIELEVIPKAKGRDVVQSLMDPETIGFIFMSHTYQTQATQSTVAIGADGHPLPTDILSAATPALRFASFYGCSGLDIINHYQVGYEFKKTPGKQILFFNLDRYLSANFFGVDNLGKLLRKQAQELQRFTPQQLMGGDRPNYDENAVLRISAKDISSGLEPRYVSIDSQIVGMIGSDESDSNLDTEWATFQWSVPGWIIKRHDPSQPYRVKILSAELSPGAMVDNYLIRKLELETADGRLATKEYDQNQRIGEKDLPKLSFAFEPQGEARRVIKTRGKQKVKWKTEALKLRQLDQYLLDHGQDFTGDLETRRTQYLEYVSRNWRSIERKDRNPELWENAQYKGRFYQERLSFSAEGTE